MKVCNVCRQSEMLCNVCARNVEEGRIKKIDVELSHALNKIDRDIDFVETVETKDKLYVVVDSLYFARFIGPGGKTIRKISETIGKQIKLLEKTTGSDRAIIEKLIGVPVIGVSRVYSGTESYKVRVEKRYANGVTPLADVVGKLMNRKVNFFFE